MLKIKIIAVILFFTSNVLLAQNQRDIIIQDSLYSILYNVDKYEVAKKTIQDLEDKYGKEPDLKYQLLNNSFINKDYAFFKKELTDLVENFGVNLLYFKENESYYEAITVGELSKWFKEMYLDKHFIWMKNNFLKQIDLKKLNEIRDDDQMVNRFSIKVLTRVNGLDSIQKKEVRNLLDGFFFTNISELSQITNKYKTYPSGKSFGVVQNHFGVALLHNYQSIKNFDKTWMLFSPFYKKAYLKNEIDYIVFKNYDNQSFIHYKNQAFGLLEIETVPELFNPNNLKYAPIKDIDYYNQIIEEFNWNKKDEK